MEQRKFVETCFDNLMKMRFFTVCTQASLKAAPHLVPKESGTKYITTIDPCPINTVTRAGKGCVPIFEAELIKFIGSTHFAPLDFGCSY